MRLFCRTSVRVVSTLILSTLTHFVSSSTAEGRLATARELSAITEFDRALINVSDDGKSRVIREFQIRVNNDQGRESESVQELPFNDRSQKLRVIDAYTVNGTDETLIKQRVAAKNIETKSIGDFTKAFDSQKQITLTYPNVQVGSKIYLKYELVNHEVAFKDFWSTAVGLGGSYIEDYSVTVRSKRKLYAWKSDPNELLSLTEKRDGKYFVQELKSKSLIATTVTQEEYAYFLPERMPYALISTLSDWSAYAKDAVPIHEALLAEPLPPGLAKIRDEAAKESTVLAKLQKVTALVSQEYRYFGDWRRRNGGYIPRALSEIDETRYGDCKDLSLATSAIYRALGFQADVAWIWRGEMPLPSSGYRLPVDSLFNHAITRVMVDKTTYWIDATNPVSYARGVFSDIENRPAYVLGKNKAFLDSTPALEHESSFYQSSRVYELQKNRQLKVKGDLSLQGRAAIGMTIKRFYNPTEQLHYDLIRALSLYGKVLESSVGDFGSRTRIVEDLKIPVAFTISDIGLKTSAGFGFPLMREDIATRLMTETRDRLSDLFLDFPGRSRNIFEIRGVKKVGTNSLDCQLETEWVSVSRKVTDVPNGVRIEDQTELRKAVIPNAALLSPEFGVFQDRVRDCFNRSAVILREI